MKPILDLTKAINNYDYYYRQFANWGNEKNILFVSPELSSIGLYKMILPFFSMYNENTATAITGLHKYDYKEQLLGGDEFFISDDMIEWADFVVFPFTTQPLVIEFYERIRSMKKDVRIVFSVDFNFYELSHLHPFKYIFDEPIILSAVEDNIWFADICLTSNSLFAEYLLGKFKGLAVSKYKNNPSNLRIACMPYMIDTEIVLKNIDYEPIKAILVQNENEHISSTQKHIEDIAKVAQKEKEKSIEVKKNENYLNNQVDLKDEHSVAQNQFIKQKDNDCLDSDTNNSSSLGNQCVADGKNSLISKSKKNTNGTKGAKRKQKSGKKGVVGGKKTGTKPAKRKQQSRKKSL